VFDGCFAPVGDAEPVDSDQHELGHLIIPIEPQSTSGLPARFNEAAARRENSQAAKANRRCDAPTLTMQELAAAKAGRLISI
jgi:hypothetical protein